MMDPITALGVAGNIVQFIDFGIKATSKAHEIHSSADGALKENLDLEVLTEDLATVIEKLEALDGTAMGHDGLDDLCQHCGEAADKLLTALKELKTSGQKTKVKSVRMALKAIWGKKGVEEMKTRLEGYRDELQFHVLVSLKSEIDVESTRQSERFKTLDAHANAIFEAIYAQQTTMQDAIQAESARSDDRHVQTVTTIVTKQEEDYLNVRKSVTQTGELVVQAVVTNRESLREILSSENLRSDERHRGTIDIIVSRQDETHTEVIETLQSLDSMSRAEQEATRHELQQMKEAMVQIEKDIKRRDEELRGLLEALNHTHNSQKRQQLQERSNAVTVALCALITIYESLQKIVLGLQAHARLLVTSANLNIWGSKPQIPQNGFAHHSMLEAVSNIPSNILSQLENLEVGSNGWGYLLRFTAMFGEHCRLQRLWDNQFAGIEGLDYETIGRQSVKSTLSTPSYDRDYQVCVLVRFLDTVKATEAFYRLTNSCRNLETFKSVIVLTAFLVECFGHSGAAEVIGEFGLSSDTYWELDSLSEDIIMWSIIGRIAGFQSTADRLWTTRQQKWGIAKTTADDIGLNQPLTGTVKLLRWLFHQPAEKIFTFSLGASDSTRARAAPDYALVEYLVEFGFPLLPPVIVVGRGASELHAQVERTTRGENDTLTPREQEYAEYLQIADSMPVLLADDC